MVNMEKKDAKPHMNIFCPWCDYKEYCEEYQIACKKTDYKFNSIFDMDDISLISEWKEVKNTEKLLEMRERELSMIMMERIQAKSANLVGLEDEVYVRQSSRKAYDLDTVYKYVPSEHFPKLVTVNKKAVDRYLEENSAVKDKITSAMVVNYTAPFLATRKVKKDRQ